MLPAFEVTDFEPELDAGRAAGRGLRRRAYRVKGIVGTGTVKNETVNGRSAWIFLFGRGPNNLGPGN